MLALQYFCIKWGTSIFDVRMKISCTVAYRKKRPPFDCGRHLKSIFRWKPYTFALRRSADSSVSHFIKYFSLSCIPVVAKTLIMHFCYISSCCGHLPRQNNSCTIVVRVPHKGHFRYLRYTKAHQLKKNYSADTQRHPLSESRLVNL